MVNKPPLSVIQDGYVLLLMLSFSLVITLMSTFLMESAILQRKMAAAFYSRTQLLQKLNRQLQQQEKILANSFDPLLPSNIRFLQFVPDTLHWQETAGRNYYQIQLNHQTENGVKIQLRSTFAVRNKPSPFAPVVSLADFIKKTNILPANFIQSPLNIKLASDLSAVIIWHLMNEGDVLSAKISIYHYPSGRILQEFLTSPVEAIHGVNSLIPVDSMDKGKVDFIYFIVDGKRIGRIEFNGPPGAWQQNFFTFEQQIRFIYPLIIGPHPLGRGALLYACVEEKQKFPSSKIIALSDNLSPGFHLIPYFTLDSPGRISAVLLRQGDLLFSEENKRLKHHNSFTGEFIQVKKISLKNPLSVIKNTPPTASLQIIQEKPLAVKNTLSINGEGGEGFCELEIDSLSLGRQTYEVR